MPINANRNNNMSPISARFDGKNFFIRPTDEKVLNNFDEISNRRPIGPIGLC